MTQDEAIVAIQKARRISVVVPIFTSYDGSKQHTENFRVRKEIAIAAIKEVCDLEYEPNIEILEGGSVVIIGKGWGAQ